MPVNVLQVFQIMISTVSFDYFPPFEYINVDFTGDWSWSTNFEWIGYDTVNFLVGIGSIAFFLLVQMLVHLVLVVKTVARIKCPCKWLEQKLSKEQQWFDSLNFVHGTFFDLLTCAAVAMSMLDYWGELKPLDKISIVNAVCCLTVLTLYFLFIVIFAVFKSGDMALKHRQD